jgi:protease-4
LIAGKNMRVIRKLFLYGLASLGGLTLVTILLVGGLVLNFSDGIRPLPTRILLEADLNAGLAEVRRKRLFLPFGAGPVMMREFVDALDAASRDDRVQGLIVRFGPGGITIAQAQELRDAVAAFSGSGKFTLAFSESFGGIGSGTVAYYLASAFDTIWVQPSGAVGLTGIALEAPFLKGALDKLGVSAKVEQRQEYKAAAEMFTREQFSDPARASLQQLVNSWFAQVVTGIATARGLEPDIVRELIDEGPYLAQEALAANLVDGLGYWTDVLSSARASASLEEEVAGRIRIDRYLASVERPNSDGSKVALIYGVGAVLPGTDHDPLSNGATFAADTVAKAIATATRDKDIRAILFRIDSPGGAYTAADTVWREVDRASRAGKPVVVSMAGEAASGGYFVAMPADRIVAQPGTVTGSIGVFAGKAVTEAFWQKLGITWDEVHAGDRATMWSQIRDFPPGAEDKFSRILDAIYEDFTAKLASGRQLSEEQVDAVARGRVWSGADAHANGLVDVIGGFSVAIAEVKRILNLTPEESINLVEFPKPRSRLRRVVSLVTERAEFPSGQTAALMQDLGRRFSLSLDDLAGFTLPIGVLQLPPFRLKR